MSQDELDALAAQHGGITGTNQIGPKDQANPDKNIDSPNFDPSGPARIPVPNPAYEYVFKDGARVTLRAKTDDQGNADTSQFDVVKPLSLAPGSTASANNSVRTVSIGGGKQQLEVKDPSDPTGQTWVAVNNITPNPDQDQITAIQRQILEGQRTERETNAAAGKGYLTNDQVATIDRDAAANSTSAADVQIRRDQLSQTAKDAEVTAGLRQQEIDNTRTNQQADIDLRKQAQQAQIDAQKAANDLASKRLALDTAVQNHAMSADDAKQQYLEQYNAADLAVKHAQLLQTQIDAANRESDAVRTNATTVRGQDLQTQNETANRQATAANTALSQAEAGGKTGADILNQRATNARDTLNQTLGLTNNKNFGLGTQLPAGFGSQLLGGIDQWTTQLAGGADVLKTAQDLVHNANPTLAGTPAGAAWSAVMAQMLQAKQSQDASAGTTFTPPSGTNAPGASAPAAPGAPTSTLAGQTAPQDYQPGSGFAQSDIPEGSGRRVTVTPDGNVHVLFNPPTGSAPPADDSTTLGGIA